MDLLKRDRARLEFERFAADQADWLLRSAYLMCGDRGEAEELVQECLLRVARRWPRVRSTSRPGAYARRVLFHLTVDGATRRTRRRTELRAVEAPPVKNDQTTIPETLLGERAELVAALAALPPRQRAVLVLRYFGDLTENQVAAILGCSLGTVKSSASRGLLRLRAALEPPAAPSVEETPQAIGRRAK